MAVKKLVHAFETDIDVQLQKTFRNHSYVGMLTPDQILIQFDTKLILCSTFLLLQEYLYQTCLDKLQQMDIFTLTQALGIKDMLAMALEHPDAEYDESKH